MYDLFEEHCIVVVITGLVSESESEGSDFEDYDSLHPPTTPLHNQPNNRTMEGSGGHDLMLEDYDFYD